MNRLMRLENQIVNLDQISKVEFTPAYVGGEPHDERPGELTAPRKAKLELTLTSVHLTSISEGYNELQLAAASESDDVIVIGELAERAWDVLCAGAAYGVLVQPEGAGA